ncbi:MAG: tRNA (adenosine(37)-N6)-threonylcarbamoyltransferase complex transferase subunit TsaD [Gammaproteobacteria bacterium]|nr:tRNA (adenosine(37)-N6)-threonylcarbamoyltransferase complex transferase subunit TsaD [Gammaproteobacteria bacterium]
MNVKDSALVLGVETSCDETSLALYRGGSGLLGQVLHSQINVHRPYGGVVPELAARDHVRRLEPLMSELLTNSAVKADDIDLVAYTAGPGLAGALLTGAVFARSLAFMLQKPCTGVHHMEAHLLSVNLDSSAPPEPYVALLVSGGHTMVAVVEGLGKYSILGSSLDDACGEAFDKVAKLLGLEYPGGPALSKLAQHGRAGACRFSRPMAGRPGLDMSFSGLKTQVLREVHKRAGVASASSERGGVMPSPTGLSDDSKADVARAFEECVVDVLTDRSVRALEQTGCESLVVAGGVGANQPLRQSLKAQLHRRGMRLYIPPVQYCTDNAAMVAYLGWRRRQQATEPTQNHGQAMVRARWPIDSLEPVPQPSH